MHRFEGKQLANYPGNPLRSMLIDWMLGEPVVPGTGPQRTWTLGETGLRAFETTRLYNGTYISMGRQGVERLRKSSSDGAARFDGAASSVLVADVVALRFATEFTLEAWVKPTSLGVIQPILSKYVVSTGKRGYRFAIDPFGELRFDISADGVNPLTIYSSGAAIKPGTTHFVAVSFKKGVVSFFIDGRAIGTTNTDVASIYPAPQDLYLGRWA